MNDLDTAIRSVVRALVDAAPPPPAFPGNPSHTPLSARRSARHLALAAAATVVGVAVAGGLIATGQDRPTQVSTSQGDGPTRPHAATSYLCDAHPALDVTVPDATGGPTEGPAAHNPPLADGQRGIHWTTADGTVDLRWPAQTPPIYGDGRAGTSAVLSAGESVSPGRSEIDVAPASNA